MTAAITLKLLDPFKNGKIVLFEVTYDRDWHALELVGFLALAVFGGVYGAGFCKANIWWTRRVRGGTKLKSHPIVEVALVTLCVLSSLSSSLLTAVLTTFSPFSSLLDLQPHRPNLPPFPLHHHRRHRTHLLPLQRMPPPPDPFPLHLVPLFSLSRLVLNLLNPPRAHYQSCSDGHYLRDQTPSGDLHPDVGGWCVRGEDRGTVG
jgi:hypothetical protein